MIHQINPNAKIANDGSRIRPEKSEVERLWADNSKALKLCDWSPDYAGENGFRKGLKKTIAWFTEPKNISAYKADIYNL